jgi:hypothetical protein
MLAKINEDNVDLILPGVVELSNKQNQGLRAEDL